MIVDTAKAFASVFGGLYERYRQWTDARNDAGREAEEVGNDVGAFARAEHDDQAEARDERHPCAAATLDMPEPADDLHAREQSKRSKRRGGCADASVSRRRTARCGAPPPARSRSGG